MKPFTKTAFDLKISIIYTWFTSFSLFGLKLLLKEPFANAYVNTEHVNRVFPIPSDNWELLY